MTIRKLETAIRRVRSQLDKFPPERDQFFHMYSEMTTRYVLIDPLIWAMDWDMNDFWQCAVEWPMPSGQYRDKADYVLFNRPERNSRPVIVIEAKYRGRNLGNHEAQLERYTSEMKSGLGVLTDGMVWRLYNLRRRGETFSDKYEATVDISKGKIYENGKYRGANVRQLAWTLNLYLDKDKWW